MNILLLQKLKQKKTSIQKLLRNRLIKTVSIKDVAHKIKPLTLSPQKIFTPEIKKMPSIHLPDPELSEFYQLPHIYTATLKDVIHYPNYNSLFTASRKLILESAEYCGYEFKLEKFSLRTLYLSQVEKLSGTYSVFRASHPSNYYHSLIDYLPRVYLLDQSDYQNEKINLLLSSSPNQIESFFLTKLLPNNVKVIEVDSTKLYRLEKVIFPSIMTRRRAGYLPQAYIKYLLSKVAPLRERNKKNRIFISRSKSKNRRILNEKELLNLLQRYGFKKYCLEELSVEKQIELFYDAEAVIAPHGAGLSNLIFSSKINVLELFPTQKIIPHYYYLCKALNHCYHYSLNYQPSSINTKGFAVNLSEIYQYLENLNSEFCS